MNLVSRQPRTRRETGLLIGLLCLMVLSLWALAVLGVEALSTARAYTSVAATWSVAQRDAAFHLTQYAASRNPGDYADFLQAVGRPAGARTALAELASADPNLTVARAAFRESGAAEGDVDEILRSAGLVRRLGLTQLFLDRRIALDAQMDELRRLASLLHGQVASADPVPARMGFILSRIHDTKHRINDLETDFAGDVSRISRRVKSMVLAVITVAALAVLGLGTLLTLELVRRIRRLEAARTPTRGDLRAPAPETAPPAVRLAAPMPGCGSGPHR